MKRFWQILKSNAKPIILAVLASLSTYFATGCSSFTPSDKTQTMGVYALGLPAIVIITQTSQDTENAGSDTNTANQSNPVDVKTEF